MTKPWHRLACRWRRWFPALPGAAGMLLIAVATAIGASSNNEAQPGRVSRPQLDPPRGDRCVMDAAFMRRNHMQLLLHQRDRTVREGVRGSDVSLPKCIACHANARTQSVVGNDANFCQGCHGYVAVKLDCFECHASKTGVLAAAQSNDAGAEPKRGTDGIR